MELEFFHRLIAFDHIELYGLFTNKSRSNGDALLFDAVRDVYLFGVFPLDPTNLLLDGHSRQIIVGVGVILNSLFYVVCLAKEGFVVLP